MNQLSKYPDCGKKNDIQRTNQDKSPEQAWFTGKYRLRDIMHIIETLQWLLRVNPAIAPLLYGFKQAWTGKDNYPGD